MITTPTAWAEDDLSEFLDEAFKNNLATFVRFPVHFEHLQTIDIAFRTLESEILVSELKMMLPSQLMLRSHAAFLGAVRLVASGQLAEAFMVMRGCLETALYAHHLKVDPSVALVYMSRNDGRDALKNFRKNFPSYGKMRDALMVENKNTGETLSELYEITIDFGAHPNPLMLSTNFSMEPGDAGQQYFNFNNNAFGLCVTCCARVGMCVLKVFELLHPAEFAAVARTQKISDLEAHLKESQDKKVEGIVRGKAITP
jgi:hypothetical protein